MANNRTIQIEYSEAQIRAMPDTEKLNLLLEINLIDHKEIFKQGVTLYGDDKSPGVCEKIRTQALQIVGIWLALSAAVGSLSTVVIMHIVK
jgi:hypothetical protein